MSVLVVGPNLGIAGPGEALKGRLAVLAVAE